MDRTSATGLFTMGFVQNSGPKMYKYCEKVIFTAYSCWYL